jgi:hypothetical protein
VKTWLEKWLQTDCGKLSNHSYLPNRQNLKAVDRASIVFVLRSDIPWEMLPKEMGCGSG